MVLLAVGCALLPDLLERGTRRCAARPDVVVALDPLAPDAALIAEGVAAAAARAVEWGRPCWLRILPLPPATGETQKEPFVRLDAAGRRVVAAICEGGRESEARLPPMWPGWPDRYAVTPPEGLLLRFWPGTVADARVRCTVLERGWPHGLPFALAVVVGLWATMGGMAASVAALVLVAHLFVDQGGLLGVAWLAPLRRRQAPLGWRLWRGASPLVNGAMTWVAALIVFWNIARATDYMPWRPSLPVLLLVGFALPWLVAAKIRRRTRHSGR
jgi:hypothetical protein